MAKQAKVGRATGSAIPGNPANREPATWMVIRSWAYLASQTARFNTNVFVPSPPSPRCATGRTTPPGTPT